MANRNFPAAFPKAGSQLRLANTVVESRSFVSKDAKGLLQCLKCMCVFESAEGRTPRPQIVQGSTVNIREKPLLLPAGEGEKGPI